MAKQLIRFDWAVKKLLRSKATHSVLEGFLTVLLKEEIKIEEVLESESNKMYRSDKSNRVDLLVKNSQGELILIEIQNSREWDFVSRILYGTSKVITEHIQESESYFSVKKVICVSIVYFDLGQGEDYLYEGKTHFIGVHTKKALALSEKESLLYQGRTKVSDIYPDYYIIKVNQFNDIAKTPLDEWIYFLKTEKVKAGFNAPGLNEAKKALSVMKLNPEEQKQYKSYLEDLRYEASTLGLEREVGEKVGEIKGRAEGLAKGRAEGLAEGEAKGHVKGHAKGHTEGLAEGAAKGRAEGLAEGETKGHAKGLADGMRNTALNLLARKLPVEEVAQITALSISEIEKLKRSSVRNVHEIS